MFSLIRRRPARPERGLTHPVLGPLANFRDEMEGMFGRFLDDWAFPTEWMAARDWTVEENDREVVMRLEIPGFEPTEIELRLEGEMLTVRADHAEAAEAKEGARNVRRFEHQFTLPFGTDAAAIAATYRNGVLELRLPRRPEAQPKRIEVKT